MKIFLSADIEGTVGIAHWDEAERSHPDHAAFRAVAFASAEYFEIQRALRFLTA